MNVYESLDALIGNKSQKKRKKRSIVSVEIGQIRHLDEKGWNLDPNPYNDVVESMFKQSKKKVRKSQSPKREV